MRKLVKQLFKFGLTELIGINYLISSAISFSISVIFNYIASIKFVFDIGHKQTYKDVILFIVLSIIGLLINQIIMFLGVENLSLNYMITKIGATAIVMVYNFITRKIFIEK